MSAVAALVQDFAPPTAQQQQAKILTLPRKATEQEMIWQVEADTHADALGYEGTAKAKVREQFIAQYMLYKAVVPTEERSAHIREEAAIQRKCEKTFRHQIEIQEGGVYGMFASYKNLLIAQIK